MTIKLFISYRSLDSAKVDALVARLKTLKDDDGTPCYELWQDKTSIPPGMDWWKAIVKAIIDCEIFVFMLSHESAQNVNCLAELSYARKRNRPIIPLVLEGEFAFDFVKGKNDITFWDDIPAELKDNRVQFLFYEGTSFVTQLNGAIERIQSEGWRDIPAPEPPDPRHANDATNDSSLIYDQACDYAGRLDFVTAERHFQRLIDWRDRLFGEDAHEWMVLLRQYQEMVHLDERASTRHKIPQLWREYVQLFPKPFIEGLFDPKNFKGRFGSTTKHTRSKVYDILPQPFEWIDIPAGKVTLDDIGGYLEKATTFPVPAFAIAKFPITNAQYAKFIVGGGYSKRRWWTKLGWQQKEEGNWSEPRWWGDKDLNGEELPVLGISWYEAVAFCLWLSEVSGEKIMLPTEQQWQHAAQCNTGRTYPWGEGIDPIYANYHDSGISATTPVTRYPKGATPEGVFDMVGNVWEWCLTDYQNGSQAIDNINVNTNIILRGGSFVDNSYTLRSVSRSWLNPFNRIDGGSIRCVNPLLA